MSYTKAILDLNWRVERIESKLDKVLTSPAGLPMAQHELVIRKGEEISVRGGCLSGYRQCFNPL